jgi:glucose-1-phosphate cytidylyltransferase
MKAVILAGGLGTRLSEETSIKPKPMVEIDGRPILWHIMKTFYHYGVKDFVICCGYKGYVIKEYFYNYMMHTSDITISTKDNKIIVHNNQSESWNITLVETGSDSMTGGRLKRVYEHIKDEEQFFFTYGDGVGDINISELLSFHKKHKKLATVTMSHPPSRFGVINTLNNVVESFQEKPDDGSQWINAGYFVLSPEVLKYIEGDDTIWENEPLKKLTIERELMAFKHTGFWQPMDTLYEKNLLNDLCKRNKAQWKVWE